MSFIKNEPIDTGFKLNPTPIDMNVMKAFGWTSEYKDDPAGFVQKSFDENLTLVLDYKGVLSLEHKDFGIVKVFNHIKYLDELEVLVFMIFNKKLYEI